jgi:dihydroxyacetone kinase-like protein
MGFQITPKEYVDYLVLAGEEIEKNGDYVTALDAKTGDGDHWVNLNAGFQKLIAIQEELKEMELAPMMKKIGMTLMSAIGGSSGVLYGSGYLAASKALKEAEVLDIDTLYLFLQTELSAIMERGKAKPGWKTMIDSLYEAVEAYRMAKEVGEDERCVIEAMKRGAAGQRPDPGNGSSEGPGKLSDEQGRGRA